MSVSPSPSRDEVTSSLPVALPLPPAIPPRRPSVAVGGIVVDGDRVLLIQRGHAPNQGLWSVPGGRVEWGETLHDAVVREVREETGLAIEVGPLVELLERMDEGLTYHFVIIDFLAQAVGGILQAGDDASDARWLTAEEWAALPTTSGLAPVLEKALAMARDRRAE